MHPSLEDDLKPYAPVITESFDALHTVRQCAERLGQARFRFDVEIDLAAGSAFLEAIKFILLDIAWKENGDIKDSQIDLAFRDEFLGISVGLHQPRKRSLVLLLSVLDSFLSQSLSIKKGTEELLRAVLTHLQSKWPTFLSWIPSKYVAGLNARLGISIHLSGDP